MDGDKGYADVVKGTSTCNSENEDPSPTWLRPYQREDEEEAFKRALMASLYGSFLASKLRTFGNSNSQFSYSNRQFNNSNIQFGNSIQLGLRLALMNV